MRSKHTRKASAKRFYCKADCITSVIIFVTVLNAAVLYFGPLHEWKYVGEHVQKIDNSNSFSRFQTTHADANAKGSLTIENKDPFKSLPDDKIKPPHEDRSDKPCWTNFDFGMLNAWNNTAEAFCSHRAVVQPSGTSSNALGSSAADAGWLRCRVRSDWLLPTATAPHTMCDGANIVLDLALLFTASCLPSRPGYNCGRPYIWHIFAPGALRANCHRTARFAPGQFPKDHLRDMFAAFRGAGELADPVGPAFDLAPVVLVVARERGEHASIAGASADLLSMFATLHVAGIIDGPAGGRAGLEDVQVLLPMLVFLVGRIVT